MAKTDRVLVLLEALQDRASASGPELARRLGVDVRTVRRDVVSLRDLGIPVEAERGPGRRVPAPARIPDAATDAHGRRSDRGRARADLGAP